MDELVRSHMPMIFRVAGGSARNPGVDINDLVQTATEGLLIAINRWSFEKSDASGARYANELAEVAARDEGAAAAPENAPAVLAPDVLRSSRLATYAMWWMRNPVDRQRHREPRRDRAGEKIPRYARHFSACLWPFGSSISTCR